MGKKRRKSSQAPKPATPPGKRVLFSHALWYGLGVITVALAVGYFLFRSAGNDSQRSGSGSDHARNVKLGAAAQTRFDEFAGSESCASCHQKEFDLWKASTHGHAGGEPPQAKIIARFDGKPLYFKDAVVTPNINKQGEYVFAVEQEGMPAREIKVHAAVGGGHMYGGGTQSFFQKWPDGTVRFLPFDFIRRENLWFVQLRSDKTWVPISKEISFETDLANWPPNRVLGTLTEFSNCQNCHGSQIAVSYNQRERKYDTHYQSLTINCESCHGPGKRHIELVRKPGFEKVADIGMEPLATLSKDRSLTVCFECHATKDAIREEPYLPGESLEAYFSLKLPVLSDTFTVDGRVHNFGYQSTHLYSDCYLDGSMTCIDCHDPHSQGYRDVFGKALVGKFDNGQCTSCHASKALTAEQHSHHKSDSAGNLCTSCHMPFLQHQGIGQQLVFARSDHSIPIPRPAFDQRMGIENACQKCHRDKDLTWQERYVAEWYGTIKPHHPMIGNLIRAAVTPDQPTAEKLLLEPGAKHPMAQMNGLLSYTKRFLHPNMEVEDAQVVAKLKAFSQSEDIDLKAMGLMALDLSYGEKSDVKEFLTDQLKRSGTQEGAVRARWGVAADYFGTAYASSEDAQNAIACFKKSLQAKPDSIVTMSHLALSYLRAGDLPNAMVWLKNGIKLRPDKAVLHFQLAQTYAQAQQMSEAIRELEEGLKYAPEDQMAKRMLEQLRGR